MPFFMISIHGQGDLSNGAIGFYAIRVSRGNDRNDAASKALELLSAQWATGKYALLKRSASVSLEIEECSQIGFWKAWELRKVGLVFYQSTD